MTFGAPPARRGALASGACERGGSRERGSASVEQVGLAALVALLLLAAIAAVAAGGEIDAGRDLAGAIGRRIACAPAPPRRLPPPPAGPRLRLAAGPPGPRPRPGARRAAPGPAGLPLVPVDFRRCRRESCAVAAGPHLTASGRRTTAFTQVADRRRTLGWVELTYWLYRPGARLGTDRPPRRPGRGRSRRRHVRVLLKDDPALVPLETLPGRNHYEFPAGEQPPWQWHVEGRYPGWSS